MVWVADRANGFKDKFSFSLKQHIGKKPKTKLISLFRWNHDPVTQFNPAYVVLNIVLCVWLW